MPWATPEGRSNIRDGDAKQQTQSSERYPAKFYRTNGYPHARTSEPTGWWIVGLEDEAMTLPGLLRWHGPYRFEEDSKLHAGSGVYVWAIPFVDGWLPYYVGETEWFRSRFKREASLYRGGGLAIPSFAVYRQGRNLRMDEFYIYRPVRVKVRKPEFSYELLRDHIERFLTLTQVFLAPVSAIKRELQVLERATMWRIWDTGGYCEFLADEECEYHPRPDIVLNHRAAKRTKIWGLTHLRLPTEAMVNTWRRRKFGQEIHPV
jgi:hypothetical protein